ncbi:MAG: dimethylsulfonioproprionate lyase DddP [Cocleimonas sp.]
MISYSDTRKIDPSQGRVLGDGTPNDGDRIEIGPTALAFAEWREAGLELPNLEVMREYRLERIVSHIQERDYAGVLLFDPLNIRYATDTTNMQLWNMHDFFRAVLVLPDGHMVLWDYKNSPFLSSFNPLVKETRASASMMYITNGDKIAQDAESFVGQVAELIRKHSGDNKCLAVDKIMIDGLRALDAQGLDVQAGEELMEKARSIKSADEIKAMRCSMVACEASVKEMQDIVKPGMSENEIWAQLHASNIKRGGEWIETRLLTTGPRTNPWFQECGPRILKNNEILVFDTDLVGTYGFCSDISRSWWIGDEKPPEKMISAYQHAHEHIKQNMEMLKPGLSFKDMTHKGHHLDNKFQKLKYGCKYHGIGLCDEWPMIAYPDAYNPGAFEYELQPGMAFCVEALVAEEGSGFSIKLEDQVIITEGGYENLTTYPFDEALMGC